MYIVYKLFFFIFVLYVAELNESKIRYYAVDSNLEAALQPRTLRNIPSSIPYGPQLGQVGPQLSPIGTHLGMLLGIYSTNSQNFSG